MIYCISNIICMNFNMNPEKVSIQFVGDRWTLLWSWSISSTKIRHQRRHISLLGQPMQVSIILLKYITNILLKLYYIIWWPLWNELILVHLETWNGLRNITFNLETSLKLQNRWNRYWWRMVKTKCVGDNYKILVTILAIGHQYSKDVTNIEF